MDGSTNDFKWFGEGFDGFPKRLPEDCVEYSLYIIDSKLKTPKEILSRLEIVRKDSQKITDSLLKDYIWQRENFKLKLESGKGMMYLHGVTNYGDSVEDEWLIVYILRELSNRFPEIWIKVVDTDGEFLLIEAANALPRWLNPEIADNRVWIHHNKLRIIPLSAATSASAKTAPISRPLTLEEAHKTIASSPEMLINSPLIEEEAFYRLRNYPAQINSSLHHSQMTIPRKLAYILHDRPAFIAPAVEAFYLRDPVALKPLQEGSSNLVFPPQDLVTISIRCTKVLFAQLRSQQFAAPAVWKDIEMSAENFPSTDIVANKRFSRLEMGMKVTSGFEMLVTDSKNADSRVVREIRILLEDLAADQDSGLPSDSEIAKWSNVSQEDDESWMDINFEDFENELQGKKREKRGSGIPGTFGPEPPSGFGEAKTQADLKKMVERFESFLNDEEAGIDGAEIDDMDFDNDGNEYDEDSENDSEDEDKDVSFDEKEFAKMMREMMGMPSEDTNEATGVTSKAGKIQTGQRIEEADTSDEEDNVDEAIEMRKVMERMEAELKEAGALHLDPAPRNSTALKGKSNAGPSNEAEEESDEGGDDEVNIDFNLAKNLLESFKSQAGMSGPGGNIIGMMGMQLPRDEEEVNQPGKRK